MEIRMLSEADVDSYRALRLQALAANAEAFGTTYDEFAARPLDAVAASLVPTDRKFSLGALTDDGRLVGTVTFFQEQGRKNRHIANVAGMFVAPEYRQRGVGRLLLNELVARARQSAEVTQLRLAVVTTNAAAIALYQSFGFVSYGVEPNALQSGDQSWDEQLMVLHLSDAALASPTIHHGFSHVTMDVSNLDRSLAFYIDTLGLTLVHRGRRDAYMTWGTAWICLQERPELPALQKQIGVNHVALYVPADEFPKVVDILEGANVSIVRGPVERGGGWTVNFLDPDGLQLEFHTGTLAERMKEWK